MAIVNKTKVFFNNVFRPHVYLSNIKPIIKHQTKNRNVASSTLSIEQTYKSGAIMPFAALTTLNKDNRLHNRFNLLQAVGNFKKKKSKKKKKETKKKKQDSGLKTLK
ncbi:MAG: hypothetical protein QXW48_03940 [Thermoplasmata archaeon]